MNIIDGFEDIFSKFNAVINSDSWNKLVEDFKDSDDIYLIGNGGNWAICNHGACDMTRLFNKSNINKNIENLDSQSMITSLSNDYGYNHLFMKWLKIRTSTKKNNKIMVIGVSCSGNSKNIITPIYWACQEKYKCALISGTKSSVLPENINEVILDTNHFHTGEILTLMVFYQLIHECGAPCPTIREEIIRKGVAQPLTRNI